ncbi:MAG: TatD family hydrolase [Chloroflexi bacterium]|nr:TatD family hydrolase [Chloroflexota bacterium]
MLVDTHCHLDFHQFDADREAVVERALEAGVLRILIPGIDLETSRAAIRLSEQYDCVVAAVGIHPNNVAESKLPLNAVIAELSQLAAHEQVFAIGEIGLDYYWDKTPPVTQHRWFDAQLSLANDLALPVIIHNREATDDTVAQLLRWVEGGLPQALSQRPGVLHSYSGDWDAAQTVIDLGFCLGFTGPVTYKNANMMREVAEKMPFDRMLIETDAPFLTPKPHRGDRNEPAYVRYVAERLAEVKGLSPKQIGDRTTRNAATLFGWTDLV